jgi:hypothetical protein
VRNYFLVLKEKRKKAWPIQKKELPLHPLFGKTGAFDDVAVVIKAAEHQKNV